MPDQPGHICRHLGEPQGCTMCGKIYLIPRGSTVQPGDFSRLDELTTFNIQEDRGYNVRALDRYPNRVDAQHDQNSKAPSRYEAQKRRDWNTFRLFLSNHRPPLALAQCTPVHVLEFLRYLYQVRKSKVHNSSCLFFGVPHADNRTCPCPLRQAWGNALEELIERLQAAFEENGGNPESNPFVVRLVHLNVLEVLAKVRLKFSADEERKRMPAGQSERTAERVVENLKSLSVEQFKEQGCDVLESSSNKRLKTENTTRMKAEAREASLLADDYDEFQFPDLLEEFLADLDKFDELKSSSHNMPKDAEQSEQTPERVIENFKTLSVEKFKEQGCDVLESSSNKRLKTENTTRMKAKAQEASLLADDYDEFQFPDLLEEFLADLDKSDELKSSSHNMPKDAEQSEQTPERVIENFKTLSVEKFKEQGCDVLESSSNKNEPDLTEEKQVFSHSNSSPKHLLPGDSLIEKDEIFMDVLQKEIMNIGNISEVSIEDCNLQSLLRGQETVVLCCHDGKDKFFEFYFKDREDMANVVGVGLEYAKAILVEGWRVKIKEISKTDWQEAWNKAETCSNTIYKLLKLGLHTLQDTRKEVDYLDSHQTPLMWDLAKYLTLKETIATLRTKYIDAKYATTPGGSSSKSSSSTSQSSDSNDQKESSWDEAFTRWFRKNIRWNRENGKDDDDDGNHNKDGLAHLDLNLDKNADTTVSVELLFGGEILGELNYNEDTRERLRILNRKIEPNLEFTFINRGGIKKVQATVGNICFHLGRNLGWFHDQLKVSFGLFGDDKIYGELVRGSFKHLDVKPGTENIKSSHTMEKKKGKEIVGRIAFDGKPYGVGFGAHIEGKKVVGVGDIRQRDTSFEKSCDLSAGGLIISDERDPDERIIVCNYIFPQSKDTYADLSNSPMCNNQAIKFQGAWRPLDDQDGCSPKFVEYTLEASRCLEEILIEKKVQVNHHQNKITLQESHTTCTQIYVKTLLINHSMLHLDGKPYTLRERVDNISRTMYFSGEESTRPLSLINPLVKIQDCS